jgi:uncharacterized protein with FMN-binding domain
LAVILLLVYLFVPRDEKPDYDVPTGALYIPGTYTAEIEVYDTPVSVDVTVSDEEILMVGLNKLEETHEYFYPLLEPVMDDLSREIVAYQTTQILPGDEAPYTGQAILEAVESALAKARLDENVKTAKS